jgi:hypothetical protein
LVAQPVFACATVGVCGTRTVDGNPADWNLTKDLYTSMREAGRTDKSQLGNFYFTYDSSTQTGYVLVLATGTNTVVQNTSDAWVKNYAVGNSPIPFTAFKWVVSNGKTVGYEASFTLAPGSYSQVEVHVQVASGRTCSTGKRSTPYSALITLKTPSCPTPPSSGGTAKCGTAVVDGSIAEWNTTSTSPDLFSKLYQESTSLQTGNLFVRYDQATQTAYVLAMTTSGYVAINYLPWNWVTLDGQTVVSATASNSASFAWVKNGTTLVGYEASFKLAPGTWQRLHAQLKTAPSNKVSNHFKATNGDQTLVANCGGGTGGTCATGKSATVDGKITDWDLSADLLKPMVKEGTTTQTADLYVRYDTARNRAYVLTLARTGYVAINYLPWNFVKLNNVQVVGATDSTTSTTFRWVYNSAGKRIGYEASFALTAGSTANIFAQMKTAPASNTAAHFKSQASATVSTVCAPLTYALGNQVYQENNGTAGYQATGTKADQPKAGVTVQLFQGTQWVATKTTGTDGCYLFDGLAAGSYSVVLPASQFATGAALNTLRASAIGFGGDTSTDDGSDHNGSQQVVDGDVRTNDYSLGAGLQPLNERVSACTTTTPDANTNLTADLALEAKPPVVYGIGNRVWFEKNGTPGYQPTGANADLPAIGVPVELTGPFGGDASNTVTTGADGCYLFDNLAAGDYALRISSTTMAGTVLNGFVPVTTVGIGNVDDNADQNGAQSIKGGDVTTAAYTLGAGKQPTSVSGVACTSYTTTAPTANLNLTADFAFQLAPVVKVALGNQVYKEANGTAGYQATGANPDLPLAGVEVELYDATTNAPADASPNTATTGADGCYLFDNLDSGSYYAVIPADQFGATGAAKGLQASLVGLGAITNTTTDDTADHNGTAATDGSVKSNTIALTPGNQPEKERTTACTSSLPDKNTNLTVDFALEDKPITEVAIGNRVWKDLDVVDGKFTAGTDLPLSGVTVTVVNNDTDASYTTTTDANGCYLVRGLSEGNYVVKILAGQQALTGLQGVAVDPDINLAGDDQITDDSGDQNGVQDGVGGDTQTGIYRLRPGTMPVTDTSGAACGLRPADLPDVNVNETADFAFQEIPPVLEVALGNLVWVDMDGLPGYAPGVDLPRANVVVELRNEDGTEVANVGPTMTDQNGCYLFDNLDAGTYYVQIPAANFSATGALYGYSPLPDPDGTGGPLTSYSDDQTIDDDLDQNGRPQANATGNVVTSPFVLARNTQPQSESGSVCASKKSGLPDVNVNLTADFAFEDQVAIGNLVWIDGNKTPGFQPNSADKTVSEELGKEVQVNLHQVTYNADDTVATDLVVRQMSTVGGFYLFDNLSPGKYYVEIPAKEFDTGGLFGYDSMAGSGTDGTTDDTADENGIDATEPNLTGVVTRIYDLQPGAEPVSEAGQQSAALTSLLPNESVNLTADLGFKKSTPPGAGLMSLASTVYLDLNHNGRLDGTEPVVPGVTVQLEFIDPILSIPVTLTDTTDDNGNYFFGNLDIGVPYTVRIPVSQMDAGSPSGKLAQFIRDYYAGLPVGIDPVNVTVKPQSTLDTVGSADDSQIDNDDNGLQASFGDETLSPAVTLVFGNEPVNGVGTGKEFAAGSDNTGMDQDNTTGQVDNNGDMTVDFGFVHQCQSICDINGNGTVDDTDLETIAGLRGTNLPEAQWGAPRSGNCGGRGTITGNDFAWCRAIRLVN